MKIQQRILLNTALEDCLCFWLTSDFYPNLAFSKVPSCPSKWSSSDAWGERVIGGSRQVRWQMVSPFNDKRKEMTWTVQTELNTQFIQLSGLVGLESDASREKTWLVMTVTDVNLNTNDLLDAISESLTTQLDSFKASLSPRNHRIKPKLKMAV